MPRAKTPDERLRRYRQKRDFTKTPEPSGAMRNGPPAANAGNRFVVQRHRARRLHYDLRLEAAGVLLSWAVPKGPTLDPAQRRLAVHVEDHPLDYFDFEGVIGRGEYGGGDVIVWDWGTWQLAKGDNVLDAVEDGDLHFDLSGEKLRGRFVLVRRGGSPRDARENWLLLHKHDDDSVDGWDPEDHPRSVKTGRTNDEVAADPDATWSTDRTFAAPTEHEIAALDGLGKKGTWELQGRRLSLTNLDKVLFPARQDAAATTKRDLIRYFAQAGPLLLPYLHDRPVNMLRYPDGADAKGFWQKAVPNGAPEWLTRWRNHDADPGETEEYVVLDSVPALAWAANLAALELNPWTSSAARPHEPDWALVDIDPGDTTSFDDVVVLARLYRTALEHLGVDAQPKVTGKRGIQIWIPLAAGYTFDETRQWIEAISRAVGGTVPDLVSWEWEKRNRDGKARLDYTQNAINKTLVAPFSTRPAAGAPVSVPIEWDELDDPDLRPDRWTIADVGERTAAAGDPLARMIGRPQRLPEL